MPNDRSRRRAQRLELDRDAGELVIEWRDGAVTRHGLEDMRRSCPCAQCKKARTQDSGRSPGGGLVMLEGDAATATAEARSVERVGRYGLRITWADGHDYGIYSLEQLRSQGDTGN